VRGIDPVSLLQPPRGNTRTEVVLGNLSERSNFHQGFLFVRWPSGRCGVKFILEAADLRHQRKDYESDDDKVKSGLMEP
jgi:hypothetical protein